MEEFKIAWDNLDPQYQRALIFGLFIIFSFINDLARLLLDPLIDKIIIFVKSKIKKGGDAN